MIKLIDTFNNVVLSQHRSVFAAVKAQIKHIRSVRKHNGSNSYLTYAITQNGKPVSEYDIISAESYLLRSEIR